MEKWKKRIQLYLEKAGKKGLTFKELTAKCKVRKEDLKSFRKALDQCLAEGVVLEHKRQLVAASAKGLKP